MGKLTDTYLDRRTFIGFAATASASVIAGGVLAGCTTSEVEEHVSTVPEPESVAPEASPEQEAPSVSTGTKSLVAVFSCSGNTLSVARRIQELIGGEFFRIEPAEAYTDSYDELLERGRQEQNDGYLPPLIATVENWDDYSTVFLGFPTWWSHMPPAVMSFLNDHNLTGKTVLPFNTSGSSGFANTLSDLTSACPNAQLLEGFSINADEVATSLDRVDAWLQERALLTVNEPGSSSKPGE